MNEASQAKEGIEPSVFPQDLLVYRGHYNQPHVVKGTHIKYVGFPYQVLEGKCNLTKCFPILGKEWHVNLRTLALYTQWLVYALDIFILIIMARL